MATSDAADRKVEAAIEERSTYPLAAFAHLEIGQADDGKRRKPVGEMDFDGNFGRAASGRRATAHHGKRHVFSRPDAPAGRVHLKALLTSRAACQ